MKNLKYTKVYQTKVPKGAIGKGLIDMMAIFLARGKSRILKLTKPWPHLAILEPLNPLPKTPSLI